MSGIFSAQTDAFRALMVGTGDAVSSAPGQLQASQVDDGHEDGKLHSCGGCAGGAPCGSCGGNVPENSPAFSALEWGMMSSADIRDPFWRAAAVGQAVRDAPSRDDSPAWAAVDRLVQNTQSAHLLMTQGLNAPAAFVDLFGNGPSRVGDFALSPGERLLDAKDDDPGAKPNQPGGGSGEGGGKLPGFVGESDTYGIPYNPCCCKAVGIKLREPVPHKWKGFKLTSGLHVNLEVGKGSDNAEQCTLVWEEFSETGYPAQVGPPIPAGVYVDLSEHPVFEKMAENARAGLKSPCGDAPIPEIVDQPVMQPDTRLTIRITLKSGCDDSAVTIYILNVATDPFTQPVVINQNFGAGFGAWLHYITQKHEKLR